MPSSSTAAYVVAREGGDGRSVIAADWYAALGQVLREEGVLAGVRDMQVRVAASGVVARVDGAVWTVRQHTLAELPDDAVTAACQRALAVAMERVPSESGAVLLVEGSFLRFVAVAGPHGGGLLGIRLPDTAGVAGRAVQTQRAVVVNDARATPDHFASLDRITGYQTRQVLAVPVSDGGIVYGVLELMNADDGRRYDGGDAQRVEAIGGVLGRFLGRRAVRPG